MATIVNDGLSAALYAAICRQRESYSRTGDLSTTSAIDSPRIRCLKERHDSDIIIQASSLLPAFFGGCVHGEIERWDVDFERHGIVQEREFIIDFDGIKFSGRPDIYTFSEACVGDYKTTSLWTYQYHKDGKREHIAQININAYLIRRWGYPCDKGWVELIFLDWKLSSAKRDSKYPRRTELIRIDPLWSDREVEEYLRQRIAVHVGANTLPDESLPFCTPHEQWQKPHKYAVMKKGRASAVRLCDTMDDAERIAADTGRHAYIVERPGEKTRCEDFCEVRQWCNQYALEKNNVQEDPLVSE